MRLKRTLFISACVVLAMVAITTAAAALTITSISPASAFRGTTVTVKVTGTGFLTNAQVWVRSPAGVNYPVTESAWSSTTISGSLVIPSTASVGSYTLYVQNPGQTAVAKASAFKVGIKPTITSISPATVPGSGGTYTAYVTGSGFLSGAQVVLKNGGTTISPTNEYTETSSRIRFTLTVPAIATPGYYSVSVTNPGFPAVTKASALLKSPRTMTVTGISPTVGYRGNTITAYIAGTGFTTGTQVRLTGGTTTIYASGETTTSSTQIRCTVTVPSTAYVGYYTVSVQAPGTTLWISKTSAFRVISGSGSTNPVVTDFSPDTIHRGTTVTAYIYGNNFQSGAQVKVLHATFPDPLKPWAQATGETVLSPTTIRCTIFIPSDARGGTYSASVANPNAPSNWYGLGNAFNVV